MVIKLTNEKQEETIFFIEEAKKNLIKIGYYHFASLNTVNDIADAKAEVNYFISVIKKI